MVYYWFYGVCCKLIIKCIFTGYEFCHLKLLVEGNKNHQQEEYLHIHYKLTNDVAICRSNLKVIYSRHKNFSTLLVVSGILGTFMFSTQVI